MSRVSAPRPIQPNTSSRPGRLPPSSSSLLFSSSTSSTTDDHTVSMPSVDYSSDRSSDLHLPASHGGCVTIGGCAPSAGARADFVGFKRDTTTLAVTPEEGLEFGYDYFTHGRESASSQGSEADEFKGFFNDLHLEGIHYHPSNLDPLAPYHPTPASPSSRNTPNSDRLSAPSPPHHYSSSAPTHSSMSALIHPGLPSPFQYAGTDSPFQPPRLGSGWDSVNPFAAEVEYDANNSEGRHPGTFALVKSNEDARTPQACQACRARKSKCDGLKNCSRCVNRGIPCVYVVRSPRVRAPKRMPPAAERAPSTVSLSSCLTSEPLVNRPYSTPSSSVARGSGPRARRRSSDTAIGLSRRGSIRRESEVRGLPQAGDPFTSRRPSAKFEIVGPASRPELVGWEGDYSSASPSRSLSRADPHSASPHEVLTPPFGPGQPWGVPAPYEYSPPTQSFSASSYPTSHLYGAQTYQPHPHGMAPPPAPLAHAHSVKPQHSFAQPPTPTSSHYSTGPLEHQQLPPSPLAYFAPIPSGMAAPVSSANVPVYPAEPSPAYHPNARQYAYAEPQPAPYYSSSPFQPRRSSMPSFRPPPPSASQLGLFKARAPVEMVREEDHYAADARRLSGYEGAGGWEELGYSGRR